MRLPGCRFISARRSGRAWRFAFAIPPAACRRICFGDPNGGGAPAVVSDSFHDALRRGVAAPFFFGDDFVPLGTAHAPTNNAKASQSKVWLSFGHLPYATIQSPTMLMIGTKLNSIHHLLNPVRRSNSPSGIKIART